MDAVVHQYKLIVLETYLDMLGHVNHAAYLTLFEEARWDLLTKNGYGLKKIIETRISPTVLGVTIRYLKEILVRDEIIIETRLTSFKSKIGQIAQTMQRSGEICCAAEFTFGIMDLNARRLIVPPSEWLKALGVSS